LESYWAGKLPRDEFVRQTEEIRLERLKRQKAAGIDLIGSNDFSLYDSMLDLALSLDVVPARFRDIADPLDLTFAVARGTAGAPASEMTKWFDSNYHYIVPEIEGAFTLKENIALKDYRFAREKAGVETVPGVIGPYTFLRLSKGYEAAQFAPLLQALGTVYRQILTELQEAGVALVRLEEPALTFDLSAAEADQVIALYKGLTGGLTIPVYVQTYYESLSQYKKLTEELPVQGIGLDFSVNGENLENLKKYGFPKDKVLIAGVVAGRDVWKTDYRKALALVKEIAALAGKEELVLSNAAPLFHLPVSLAQEKGTLDDKVLALLSFADERLGELAILKSAVNEGKEPPAQDLEAIRSGFKNEAVQKKVAAIDEKKVGRKVPFAERQTLQQSILNLPLFPTTTIGSYPQTAEVRKNRADFKAGRKTEKEYLDFVKKAAEDVIRLQEELDIDVLVHGEFERNDMVEYFGELLDGFAFTKNGWVQSYGSRYVKPPLIYSDVSRPKPMTVDTIAYAQSLTKRPVKGMLTGPVTILCWSFYRRDIPKKEIAYQIALALHEEVLDLEKAGVKVVQIDEPAFREGLPLKKSKQREYLDWAVAAFKLTNQDVKPETQIHTHMCYSEFNEILPDIYAMDSDVISIEASRSRGEIIGEFDKVHYDHGIGLGVYDIHSPRVPSEEEMKAIVEKSVAFIDKRLFWVNPDCGLKTRAYAETIPSLTHMVAAAKELREKYR